MKWVQNLAKNRRLTRKCIVVRMKTSRQGRCQAVMFHWTRSCSCSSRHRRRRRRRRHLQLLRQELSQPMRWHIMKVFQVLPRSENNCPLSAKTVARECLKQMGLFFIFTLAGASLWLELLLAIFPIRQRFPSGRTLLSSPPNSWLIPCGDIRLLGNCSQAPHTSVAAHDTVMTIRFIDCGVVSTLCHFQEMTEETIQPWFLH